MRPSKFPIILIILYAICVILHAATSTAYFFAGKPVMGWIWAGITLIWVACVVLGVKTYRLQRETYERIGRRYL